MEERIKLLNKFIKMFFKESIRKTRSDNNAVSLIQYRLEKTFSENYCKNTKFSIQEIKTAFQKRGYSILDNKDYEHPLWGKPDSINYYINVDRQILTDLKLIRNKSFPDNWSEETKERVGLLKTEIGAFFK